MTEGDSDLRWQRADDPALHPVARWDGASVGEDVALEAWLGPSNAVGARYFRLFLESSDLGRPQEPLILGLVNSGRYPGHNWVEVIEYREHLTFDGDSGVTVPEGVERLVFARLAELVPDGGHLMAEYDSEGRRLTARALAAGVPPRATPVGATLAAAGCGVAFRDWYHAEGGREGSRKLQGFRAVDPDHQRRRNEETLDTMRDFLDHSAHLDWDLQARTRALAEQAVEELEGPLRLLQ
jgi:hypothetical protein